MRGKDWPNLRRMFAALCLLLISPLLGIPVGAVCWGSLERGLLVFNLLGLMGFALATRPFWRGDGKRTRGLVRAALALGVSALLDILSGRPVPFAVYFSSMVECFSLIPWIIEILQEIHGGRWRAGPVPPSPAPAGTVRRKTPPPRPKPEPVYEDPEEPVPGFPRWGYLLLVLLLGLVLLLLLTSCHSPAEVTPSPSPAPIPTPAAETTPEPELRKLPALLCDNGQWSVYMDSWEWSDESHQNSVMELSFHDRAGVCRQTLQTFSESIGSQQPGFVGLRSGTFATLTDLNFDGIEDLRLNDFQYYYKAFLWDRDLQRFVEQPTFSSIPRPYPMDGLIFGCNSSGASGTSYSAWSYSPETGYHLVRLLWIDMIDLPGKEDQTVYTERYYEDGMPTDIIETEEDLSQSDFWREYVEYCDEYVWG